jgi:hypothetical protein
MKHETAVALADARVQIHMAKAEELHLKASNYASRVCNESEEHRATIGEEPFSREQHANMWLYHYEGFKAGYEARVSND